MSRGKKHGPEEVIPKLREAEVLISQGSTQELAAKQIGVTKQTLIRCPDGYPVAHKIGPSNWRSGEKYSQSASARWVDSRPSVDTQFPQPGPNTKIVEISRKKHNPVGDDCQQTGQPPSGTWGVNPTGSTPTF